MKNEKFLSKGTTRPPENAVCFCETSLILILTTIWAALRAAVEKTNTGIGETLRDVDDETRWGDG